MHFLCTGVDHDVSFGCGDEVRRNISGAHVINVADDSERLYRLTLSAMERGSLFRRQWRGLRPNHYRTQKDQQHGITHENLPHGPIIADKIETAESLTRLTGWNMVQGREKCRTEEKS